MIELGIDIKFSGIDKLLKAPRLVKAVVAQLSKGVAEPVMKQIAPYKTGRLKSSISVKLGTGGLMATVAPHTNYAAAVNYGMPASPGRYVPAIGKRLKFVDWRADFGMWPGIKATHYVGRTMDAVQQKANIIIRQEFQKLFGK